MSRPFGAIADLPAELEVDRGTQARQGTGEMVSDAFRRAFDIAFALAVLILSAPVVLAAMAAVRLESPGSALFRQQRMGRHGRAFDLVKLRGMYVDAAERFPHLYDYSAARPEDCAHYHFHQTGDPRVTRVGRVLRKYSIDELPNFWNVLRGDMSVVGPRPEIPELAPMYGDRLARILSVRPGVTSPAKASGRDALSLEETIESDLGYVDNRSFRRDLLTILQTVENVVRGDGAS
jgi:lipopolysaccharide/colanic/teichoic acid biosynthesis glycosyltransferase